MIHARVFDDERAINAFLCAQPVGACCLSRSAQLRGGFVEGKVLRRAETGIVEEPIKQNCDDMISKESSDGQKLVANTTMKCAELAAIADYEFVPLRSGTAGELARS